jgi:hypothetical protein
MRLEFDQALRADFPIIFRDEQLSFDVGEGWEPCCGPLAAKSKY